MRVLAGLLLLAAGLSGCGGGGGDDVDGSEATSALEGQRDEVRTVASELVRAAVAGLDGRPSATTGGYEGCESAFPEEYRTFRYRATARVDAGRGATPPYLTGLGAVLTDAGFDEPTPGERPGGSTLTAVRDDLSATFSELPEQGAYVLLAVEGPCVEVPEDDRDAWQRRQDPESYL